MIPEKELPVLETNSGSPAAPNAFHATPSSPSPQEPAETRFLKWALFSNQGLRVGWSVTLFLFLTVLFILFFGTASSTLLHNMFHLNPGQPTAITTILDEVVQLAGILGAVLICSRIEHRRILDYNLAGPRPTGHFLAGLGAGILALSALVGALYAGHWLHFGAVGLSGAQIFEYGGLWGVAFLLTGFCEEGSVRCYLQFTLARGINYWWAVGLIGAMSLSGLLFQMGEGIWGVYILAAAGVVPCFLLHRSKSDSARFWQAAWVTSTFFGFIHTGNNGETGIGIFSASAIGFVFCVSIRLTGSAWWAIGFHAAWDWAQTFLYGTADSGLAAKGHFFSTSPAGPEIWSGGSDGPEGSLLVIPIVLFTLVALVLVYRRNKCMESPSPAVPARLS